MFTPGQKVKFDGKTNHINDLVYAGQVGTVDFHHFDSPTLVTVLIKAPGQRKDRAVTFHQDTLHIVH